MYSLMSKRTSACWVPNRNSASRRATSVLPTPDGPRKMNEPTGRCGLATPRRERRMARLIAEIARSWPTTRWRRVSSMWQQALGLFALEAGDRDAGPRGDDLLDVARGDLEHASRRRRCPACARGPRAARSRARAGRPRARSPCPRSPAFISLTTCRISCSRRRRFWVSRTRRSLTLAPASSITSIALSGWWRSVM